jgi:hypothetical protein
MDTTTRAFFDKYGDAITAYHNSKSLSTDEKAVFEDLKQALIGQETMSNKKLLSIAKQAREALNREVEQ